MKLHLVVCLLFIIFGPTAIADEGHAHEDSHASAVGEPAPNATPTRTIEVSLNDQFQIAFQDSLEGIRPGAVVRFVVTNVGEIRHEFSIGNAAEQREHHQMMLENPNMAHDDGSTISLAAGETGELTWRFEGEGEVVFACHLPGHFEAGMVARRPFIPEE